MNTKFKLLVVFLTLAVAMVFMAPAEAMAPTKSSVMVELLERTPNRDAFGKIPGCQDIWVMTGSL